MRLSQIALSVADVRAAQAWYRDVIGLEPAGGTNLFAGPVASLVQGVPRAASTCWWLVDRQDQFQLELFEFRSPLVRRARPGRRPSDLGYSMISLAVTDFDATLERAARAGTPALGEPIGEPGARRACVRDRDGVLVELMEDDPRGPLPRERPRPGVAAVVRSLTLSVADLAVALEGMRDALGLEPSPGDQLHGPQHEALWGLEGAQRDAAVVWADDIAIEIVSYREPMPGERPPGYRISDQGLLNAAFGFRERRPFEQAWRRCLEAGWRPNGPPVRLGAWSVVYVNGPEETSVELLHVEPWYEPRMGFRPRPTPRLAPFAGRTPARLRSERRFGRALVTGAAGGIGAELARLLAEDGTGLVLLDRDQARLDALATELGNATEVATQVADMADLEALDGTAAEIVESWPDTDLLIAGAGLDRAQSLLDFNWRQARDDFAVNTISNLVLLTHLAPAMAARGGGHVTAISSLAGLIGMPYEAPYSGSKAALAAIVESARAELGELGIGFTAVFPGFVDTPMFRANAFKHTYSVPARDAAERIYMATLRRRATLYFPARERARIALGRLLPAGARGRLTRQAMNFAARPQAGPGTTDSR